MKNSLFKFISVLCVSIGSYGCITPCGLIPRYSIEGDVRGPIKDYEHPGIYTFEAIVVECDLKDDYYAIVNERSKNIMTEMNYDSYTISPYKIMRDTKYDTRGGKTTVRIYRVAFEGGNLQEIRDSGEYAASYYEWKLSKDAGVYCPNADLGHADAQVYIGDLYYLGAYSLNKNIIQAYVWYRLAADNGNSIAASKVEELIREMTNDQLIEGKSQFERWKPGSCRQELLKAVSRSPE